MKKHAIIFLSSILLFFVSCGADNIIGGGNGSYGGGSYGRGSHSQDEIIGTWTNSSREMPGSFWIGRERGGILITGIYLIYIENNEYLQAAIYGDINSTFNYPYTVNIICSDNQITNHGTVTFYSPSSCNFNITIPGILYSNCNYTFAKQSDKFIDERNNTHNELKDLMKVSSLIWWIPWW